MRTLIAALTLLVVTVVCGGLVIVARLLGIPERPGSIYEKAPKWWARSMLFMSGTRVVIHGRERMEGESARVFVSNHVSWYDVLALVGHLPRYSFVAKAELFKVPLFGPAARAVGTIPIERENRKAAFQSYEEAAVRIRGGRNVVVFPEGTRGPSYALRPFKKGPFVLAIAAGVPIIPTLIHGTVEVLPRGSLWLRAGRVDVHLLEPVPTAGLTYEERDALAREVYERLAVAQHELYGIASPALPGAPAPAA
ncbi:lysophospholipid acyltransferase family protein [Roseisolibacter sp. H3M3-2]|uniref:lysophospholipid acyltransferase family protein n=1 Tax=Roseisolibacter sp. H3M3-2 TaxID=3031323 RepID=UPI0023DAD652|nr:lysophospholipid acyltransferase family protein [Roseisolibacter sp. H3M3-2]MDF1504851.1 lysophospholipid acyltransferase family protein [Roseisolibacter sp. H3M3-2]